MRTTRLVAVTSLMPMLLIACGLPQSSEFEPISGDDVQFELDETTTTTSSTVPPTTIDATSTTIAQTTTTEIPTELVQLYFVAGSQLNPVSQPLSTPVLPVQALAALLEGPRSDISQGLRTTIPNDAAITVVRERGTAIIDLPAGIFDAMPTRDQRLFFAQLVLTIGQLGGIGPVLFTLEGTPTGVLRGDGSTAEPDEPVTVDDYVELLSGAPSTTVTTSTTVAEAPTGVDATSPVTSVGG